MGVLNVTKKGVAVALSAQLLLATQAVTLAQAQMIGTDTAIGTYAAESNRTLLMDELQRSDVRDQIIELGVTPAEAEQRLAALSDAEINTILMQIEDGSAGADIIGTLFTVFVIWLVTDILCLTRVFSFTRCAR